MKSEWGKLALALRMQRGITQSDFAKQLGVSLSHVSNLEAERAHISENILQKYIEILEPNANEVERLKKLASFSNSKREESEHSTKSLIALIKTFEGQLSEKSIDEIRRIVAQDIGAENAQLRYHKNTQQHKPRRVERNARWSRPSLTPERFVKISLLAEETRRRHEDNRRRLDVEQFLMQEELEDESFALHIVENMPEYAENAFAILVGGEESNTLLVCEDAYALGSRGSVFVRHVLAHEYGHHIMHKDMLYSTSSTILPPQMTSLDEVKSLDNTLNSSGKLTKRIDSYLEVEAECFATMLLVPWTEMIKGTEPRYLASDFGEEVDEIDRYVRYIKASDKIRGMLGAKLRNRQE